MFIGFLANFQLFEWASNFFIGGELSHPLESFLICIEMLPVSILLSVGFSYKQSLLEPESNQAVSINDLENTSKDYEMVQE